MIRGSVRLALKSTVTTQNIESSKPILLGFLEKKKKRKEKQKPNKQNTPHNKTTKDHVQYSDKQESLYHLTIEFTLNFNPYCIHCQPFLTLE